MPRCVQRMRRCLKQDAGYAAIEYALLLALISLLSVAAIRTLGSKMQNTMATTARSISNERLNETGDEGRKVDTERKAVR